MGFSFLAYLLALPILIIFSACVPKTISSPSKYSQNSLKKIPATIWGYASLLVLIVTIYMSLTVKVTALLINKGIGTATGGSNHSALIGLGAMLAGVSFSKTLIILKQRTLSIAFLLLGIAMFLFAFSPNILIASFSAILCGIAFRTFIPYLFNKINQQTSNIESNTVILLIAFNLGAAFSPLTIAVFQTLFSGLKDEGLFVGEGILLLLLVTIAIVGQKRQEKRMIQNDEA